MDRWRRESCCWIILILAALFMMRHTVWIVYSQCDFLKAVVFFRSRWLFIRYNVWSWRITIVKVAQSITGRWALVSVSLDMFSWTPHGVLCQPSTQSGLAWNRWLFLVLSLLSTSALFQQHQCGECLNQQQCVYTYSLETEPMTGGLWVDRWVTTGLPTCYPPTGPPTAFGVWPVVYLNYTCPNPPSHVIEADTVNSFENRLDKEWGI